VSGIEPNQAVVRGQLVCGSQGIAAARLMIYCPATRQHQFAVTDADGRFSTASFPVGRALIMLTTPGYCPTRWAVQHSGEPIVLEVAQGVEIVLKGSVAETTVAPTNGTVTALLTARGGTALPLVASRT
jgi:hypothetical protein